MKHFMLASISGSVVLCLVLLAAQAAKADQDPPCTGISCLRNPGNLEIPDGFTHTINNFCPGGCNMEKHHAGSSCSFTGGEAKCSSSSVAMHWWYTHTDTCSDNHCDFSNSYWSESSQSEPVPTCLDEACSPYIYV